MHTSNLTVQDASVLALQATDGDHEAFAELYRRHAPQVFGLCLRMTGSAQDAEELAQVVFVHVWRQLALFRGSNFAAWLMTVSRRVVLNDRRTHARFASRITYDTAAVDENASATAISLETILTIETALAALSPARRTVFQLHDVEGFRAEEIAEHLGITASTVRVHLAMARKNIATRLGR